MVHIEVLWSMTLLRWGLVADNQVEGDSSREGYKVVEYLLSK